MTIDRFSKEQFEQVLTDQGWDWSELGLMHNNYCYAIHPNDNTRIMIGSSVRADGMSADTGGDSIRVHPQIKTPAKWVSGKKLDAWTKRTPGWQDNMKEKIEKLFEKCEQVTQEVGYCSECHKAMFAGWSNSQRNPGRPYATCSNRNHKSFTWLDEEPKQKVQKVEKKEVEETSNLNNLLDKSSPVTMPEDDTDTEVFEQEETHVETVYVSEKIVLNEFQQQVVNTKGKGKLVVDSCPGSGKTKTVENLVAEILKDADPSKIGAFTFSNKAASEMRWRIARTIWPDASQDELDFFANPHVKNNKFSKEWVASDPRREFIVNWVCTIHALSYRILKAAGHKLMVLSGKNQFEADNIIKDTIKELDWNEGLKAVKHYISMAIINLVEPPDSERFYSEVIALRGGPVWVAKNVAECYKRYYDFLRKRKLVDFDMMLARVIYYLRNSKNFRDQLADLFEYVIVDEAQDTSDLQMEIINALIAKSGNLVLVGDVDQSMYAFRGAHPEVLHNFDGERLTLPINYRSTRHIIATAENLIKHNYTNQEELLKPFEPRPNVEDGEDVDMLVTGDFSELASEITNIIKNDGNFGDWYILSRTRAECAALHTNLIANNIPAVNKVGGLLFGSPHIRKVLAYARLACNYQDARDNLEILTEIANVATKSFKAPLTRRRHVDGCRETRGWVNCGCPMIYEEGIDYCHARYYGQKSIEEAGGWKGVVGHTYDKNRGGFPTLKAKASQDLVQFVQRLERLDDAKSVLGTIIDDCVLPWLMADQGIVSDDLADNGVQEEFDVLLSLVNPDETIEKFLEGVDDLSGKEEGDEHNSVVLGTFHWSKGAERPKVVVNTTRCPITPPKQNPEALPVGNPVNIREERRLIYVGVTRAREKAIVVDSLEWNGMVATEPSRFMAEMVL